MKTKSGLALLICIISVALSLQSCSDDNDFNRKFIQGRWEEASERTQDYSLVYDFQTQDKDTESWGELIIYRIYGDASMTDKIAYNWHISAPADAPKQMTMDLNPKDKVGEADAWKYTEYFDIVKLTNKEMWLRNARVNDNSTQVSDKALIKLTRYTKY